MTQLYDRLTYRLVQLAGDDWEPDAIILDPADYRELLALTREGEATRRPTFRGVRVLAGDLGDHSRIECHDARGDNVFKTFLLERSET